MTIRVGLGKKGSVIIQARWEWLWFQKPSHSRHEFKMGLWSLVELASNIVILLGSPLLFNEQVVAVIRKTFAYLHQVCHLQLFLEWEGIQTASMCSMWGFH